MLAYIKGKITRLSEDSVEIECGGLGYEALISHPDRFKLEAEGKFYVYEISGENEHYLAAFSSKEEKDVFLSLIKVKGIGPKTALNALSNTTPELLIEAIRSNNTSYLKKLPGIGAKAASQIVLDLHGSLVFGTEKGNPKQYDEAREALKALKFKVKDIDEVLSSISLPGASTEEIIREALKRLRSLKK